MQRLVAPASALGVFVVASALAAACGGGGDSDGAPPAPVADAGPDTSVAPSSLCPGGTAVDWPPGPYGFDVLQTVPPDLVFDGPDGPVRFKDFFEPCAAASRLVVVRTSGAWCGSCIWSVAHTNRLFGDPRFAGRLELVDLLVSDEDNMPATVPAAARWKTRIDAPGKVAIDVKYTFAPALLSASPLPEYVVIDTRTMQLRNATGVASPENVQNLVVAELAKLDHAPRPELAISQLYDELLTEDQADMLRDMKLVAAPPPDPTNEYGDDPGAAAFGKTLFSDGQLSPSNVACQKCHDEGMAFGDGLPQSIGVSTVDRNSPDIALAAHARWQFWDGRADTLWMQALGPPENPKEMASSRLYVAHRIKTGYETDYTAVFGAKYPLPADLDTLPASGKPGDPDYDALSQDDKDAVTRVYVNVGKAIAAYERSLRVKTNPLDDYAGGDTTALSPTQKKSLQAFFVAGCPQCHWGPRLTDDAFHAVRFPTGRQDGKPDRGRIDVLPALAATEFNAASKWSDSPAAAKLLTLDPAPTMLGAFKTPALRGAARSGPYGHGGRFPELMRVAVHYGTLGKDIGDDLATGTMEPWLPNFDENAQALIPSILQVSTADLAP